MSNFQKILKELGFSASETAIYLAALALGPTSVQNIAKKAGFSRVTSYDVIGTLISRGLMSSVTKGKKQLFMAESPERLHSFMVGRLEQQKSSLKELKSNLQELKKLRPSERSMVKFYEGLEGIKAMQENAIKANKDVIYEIGNLDLIQEKIPARLLNNFKKILDKKNIKTKAIYVASKGYRSRAKAQGKIIKDQNNKLRSDIMLHGKRVVFTIFDEQIIGISIDNTELAQTLKTVFVRLWKSLD